MKKRYWFLSIFLIAVLLAYLFGPKVPKPIYNDSLPALPASLSELEQYVTNTEEQKPVRKDNQARIRWQHDPPRVTEYSIVYLHGFAGSYRDGFPVNVHIADTFGANLYLARWAGHGLRPPASLLDFSPEAAWASAKEALAIGKRIGKKVVIMSTSTGGTLAIKLAAEYPESVYGLINLSPNIEDDQAGAFVLNSPWGYEIAKMVSLGDNRKIIHEEAAASQYWDTLYPAEALVDLEILLATTMLPETFNQVSCPVLTLYYQKNFLQEDEHVEVSVYPEVHEAFATPDSLKALVPLETPGTHFIGSDIKSKDILSVEGEIIRFCRDKLGMTLKQE